MFTHTMKYYPAMRNNEIHLKQNKYTLKALCLAK